MNSLSRSSKDPHVWLRGVSFLLASAVATASAAAVTFHVDPRGDDAQAGTAQAPFATFARAQQAVRDHRVAKPGEAVTVTFGAGTYELAAPLELTAADSGSGAAPVRYEARSGDEVVISGGRRITGWQPDPDRAGLWRARLPGVGEGWRFTQLWVNGRRAVRARTPNEGEFFRLASVNEREQAGLPGGALVHTFGFAPEELATLRGLDAQALAGVQLMVYHKWDTTREWVRGLAPDAPAVTAHGRKMQSWNAMTAKDYCFFENYRAALDAPGEWFLEADGWLYYRPRAGESMPTAVVVAPRLATLLRIQGATDGRGPVVEHVEFAGLKFRHTDFPVPAEGLPPSQAAMNVQEVAVQLDGARHIAFDQCAVENIGTTAFWFRKACRDCGVRTTRIWDVGVTGVRIGEMGLVPEPVRTGGITIDNCIVQSGGRAAPHAVGVWIGHSADNAVTHCDIGDFYYTAVSVGWRWGYDESGAKRNRIEFNHLHHLGYRVLSDMGGVYTLGPSEGTSVSHNRVHDVYASGYGGWGLYTDEGSTGIRLENNLVYRVKDGGFHQHYGKENLVRNNIFAFSQEGQIAVTRAEPHLSFTFEHNLVYWDAGQLFGYGGWKAGAKVILRNNLYWRVDGRPFECAGQTWEAWQAAGNDRGSRIADPGFLDPASGDFRLKPGSVALELGFKPFDFSQAGVYGSPDWKRLAEGGPYPAPYDPAKPARIAP